MKKVELLSPAGNMESLQQAVFNGADAVYLGGKNFGARKYANNFDNNELIEAIKFCHLYGVKIYVTVNIMIFEEEIEDVLNYVRFLHENNVDALIVQDLGLIRLIRKTFPNLELHASTQCHNHDEFSVQAMKKLGVSRVVLARELSLDEIKNINVDIEKEVFVHGALCVSYSGCCLFSSMNGGRSGNRGECVGSCRLPYELYKNKSKVSCSGDYLLSTKSLCTLEKVGELIESGITSFKIEGRMKSPQYVGYITRLYREKIDSYYATKKVKIDDSELDNVKKLYNRELTLGYLFNKKGKDVLNIKTSNHIGTHLGVINSISDEKIEIKLDDDISQEDGIRFDDGSGMIVNKLYNAKGLLVNSLSKGSIATIDNKIGLKNAKKVRKTTDIKLLKEIDKTIPKKIPVKIDLVAKIDFPLELRLSDGNNTVSVISNTVQKALNSPISKERIIEQISKLGNTPFECNDINIEIDENIFISVKELNELRRDAVLQLTEKRQFMVPSSFKEISFQEKKYEDDTNEKLVLGILVRNEEQLKVAIDEKVDYIYVTDYKLYKKYEDIKNIFYRTERVNIKHKDFTKKKLLVTDFGGVYNYSKNNYVVSDYYLNVANSSSVLCLLEQGVKRVTLSIEMSFDNIQRLNVPKKLIEKVIYGKPELMVTKYCPMNMLINSDNSNCNVCMGDDKFGFKDKYGNLFPIITDNHIIHIMHYKSINATVDIKKYKSIGINCYRIELFDESKEDILKILKDVRAAYE